MLFFILPLVAIIFAIVTLVLSIISFFKEDHNNKFSIGSSIFSAAVTLIGVSCISVPAPTIYPLNSEAQIYEGEQEITIDAINFPFLNTYYSLDGSDPQNGHIYKSEFAITESTTVAARNKFLFWWSDISQSTYRFENMQITYNGYVNSLIDDGQKAVDEFTNLIVKVIFLIIFFIGLVRYLIDRFKKHVL